MLPEALRVRGYDAGEEEAEEEAADLEAQFSDDEAVSGAVAQLLLWLGCQLAVPDCRGLLEGMALPALVYCC